MDSTNQFSPEPQEDDLSFVRIFFHYFRFWPWFLGSIVVCLSIAWVYLRYTTPEYQVAAKVLVKNEQKTADFAAFEDLGIVPRSSNLENEMVIMQSRTLMYKVKQELNLGVSYVKEGRLKQIDIYDRTPVFVYVTDQQQGGHLKLSQTEENTLLIESTDDDSFREIVVMPTQPTDSTNRIFSKEIVSPWGILTLEMNPFSDVKLPIDVIIAHPKYVPFVSITPYNKTSDVLNVSIITPNPWKGADIVNTLIRSYNDQVIEDQRYVATNTIKFIDERLKDISGELRSAEGDVEEYRKRQGLTDLDRQGQLFLSSSTEYEKRISDTRVQLEILRGIKRYLMSPENDGDVAPANVGLTDQTVLGLIGRYNQEILDKKRATVGLTEINPTVVEYNTRISSLRSDVLKGINMAESSLNTVLNELQRKENAYISKARDLPTQERESRELMRQQSIKETLVIYLMQKQEETRLSLAMAVPNATVIDPADFGNPVKPKRQIIYLAAFLIGFILPIAVIYILDLFQNKVHDKEDVQSKVKAPFLGEIPVSRRNQILPVANMQSSITERFRIIISNLRFIVGDQGHKVIMVTSTFPTEGKSFVSRNLAYTLASSGNKVLLIDLDMRKSVMNQTLEMDARKGIAYYLSTPEATLKEVTDQKEVHPNLSIIPVKVFPPNPSELIESERLAELLAFTREKYDYVIVDTAPVGLVADAFTVTKYTDATVFVTRSNVTYKGVLKDIQSYYAEKKLKHLAIVLNGVPSRKGYGYGAYGQNYYVGGEKHKPKGKK